MITVLHGHRHSLPLMVADAFRFATPVERRYTWGEIRGRAARCGLAARLSCESSYWIALASGSSDGARSAG